MLLHLHYQNTALFAALSLSALLYYKDCTQLSTVQACLDSIAAAASTAGARTQEGASLDRAIEDTFTLLLRMRASIHDSSEIEDTPRAMLSLLFPSGGDSSDGRAGSGSQSGSQSWFGGGDAKVGLEGLILGAVLSLGGPSSSPRSSSAREGGSEGCTYRYSSLLRLSLYLSTVPEPYLLTLIPALLRRGREWPKVVLKAFSHLYSSRRIALDPRTQYGPSAATAAGTSANTDTDTGAGAGSASSAATMLPVTHGKSSLVAIVLEVRQ